MAKANEQRYKMTLSVPGSLVASVFDLLKADGVVMSAEPVEETTTGKRQPHYTGGKRNKGIAGTDLVLKTLRAGSGKATMSELQSAFAAHGFSPSSVSPCLSSLVKANKITRDGDVVATLGRKKA